MTVDPRLLQPKLTFLETSFEIVINDGMLFGHTFLSSLFAAYDLSIILLKDVESKDVWGYSEGKFGFQIDRDTEVIILWENEHDWQEYGYWLSNPEADAFEAIFLLT